MADMNTHAVGIGRQIQVQNKIFIGRFIAGSSGLEGKKLRFVGCIEYGGERRAAAQRGPRSGAGCRPGQTLAATLATPDATICATLCLHILVTATSKRFTYFLSEKTLYVITYYRYKVRRYKGHTPTPHECCSNLINFSHRTLNRMSYDVHIS